MRNISAAGRGDAQHLGGRRSVYVIVDPRRGEYISELLMRAHEDVNDKQPNQFRAAYASAYALSQSSRDSESDDAFKNALHASIERSNTKFIEVLVPLIPRDLLLTILSELVTKKNVTDYTYRSTVVRDIVEKVLYPKDGCLRKYLRRLARSCCCCCCCRCC